jgi:hypothetical protein
VANPDGDGYTRHLYHNTIAMTSNAVVLLGGATNVLNNIGPTSSGNLAFTSAHFVNAAEGDYHLVAGSSAIDAGRDLTNIVDVDRDGNSRGTMPDLGAYEFGLISSLPTAPQNVRIVSSP